jgi:hypothetical protein
LVASCWKPDAIGEVHDARHRRRGEEAGVQHAQAFVLADGKKERPGLPLLGRKK